MMVSYMKETRHAMFLKILVVSLFIFMVNITRIRLEEHIKVKTKSCILEIPP